jgi:hypothetical protein
MVATLFTFGVARYIISEFIRPVLLPARSMLAPIVGAQSALPAGSWVLAQKIVNANGEAVPIDHGSIAPTHLPAVCTTATGNQLGACLGSHGYHLLVRFQPRNRFWALQGIESALFLAAAAAFIAFTFYWLARRDA